MYSTSSAASQTPASQLSTNIFSFNWQTLNHIQILYFSATNMQIQWAMVVHHGQTRRGKVVLDKMEMFLPWISFPRRRDTEGITDLTLRCSWSNNRQVYFTAICEEQLTDRLMVLRTITSKLVPPRSNPSSPPSLNLDKSSPSLRTWSQSNAKRSSGSTPTLLILRRMYLALRGSC